MNQENKMRVLDAIKEIETAKQMFNMSEHAGLWFYVIGATLDDIKRFLKNENICIEALCEAMASEKMIDIYRDGETGAALFKSMRNSGTASP